MIKALKKILRRYYDGNEAFIKVLRKQGAKIGKNVQIIDRSKFLYEPWYVNLLEIGDEVVLAAGVRIVSHDSSYTNVVGDLPIKYGKINIGNNSYIGVNSIILPGVTIGKSTLIGAGSVVNRNIPDGVVAAGNPIRIISTIDEGVSKYVERMKNNTNSNIHYLDLGGSHSQMVSLYGNNLTDNILNKYNSYFENK